MKEQGYHDDNVIRKIISRLIIKPRVFWITEELNGKDLLEPDF
jgi:hypothetical protein